MNQIASIPPTAQAKHIHTQLQALIGKAMMAREHRFVPEMREIAGLVKALEESLRWK